MNHLCFSVLCMLCLCARLFICALWSPAGKGLTSWLSFVVSNCEFVTFPLVSLVSLTYFYPSDKILSKVKMFQTTNNNCEINAIKCFFEFRKEH